MDIIRIPVNVHLVADPTGEFTTQRDNQNVSSIFEQVNRIWDQAKINFEINSINSESIPNTEIRDLCLPPNGTPPSTEKLIDTYLVKYIVPLPERVPPNGRGISVLNRTLIADITTVNDYRAAAHEFGHVLGLEHLTQQDRDVERLMEQNVNGENLIEREIQHAREQALLKFH